jgi:hypothetical protein
VAEGAKHFSNGGIVQIDAQVHRTLMVINASPYYQQRLL